MWQSNVSWKEGLFSEIPFKRFQAIKTKSQWDAPLAIFTRLNPTGGDNWPNLRLEGIQSSTSPAIGAMDTLFGPSYYIVAVDTRLRTTECLVTIKTQDKISATVHVTVEYQVESLEILLRTDDPISRLKDRANETIQEYASQRSYFTINESDLKNGLRLETQNDMGVSIKRFFNVQINWPDSISKKLEQTVVNQIDAQTQDAFNQIKIQKLNEYGIYDKVVIANVLSRSDADFEVVMQEVREVRGNIKDQAQRDEKMFDWLAKNGYLTRADVQNVIDSLTNRANDISSLPMMKGNNLLSSDGMNQQPKLSSNEDDNQGEIKISKRKLNFPKDKN